MVRYAWLLWVSSILLVICSAFIVYGRTERADILIFSPHPDDAALCCSGLIQHAVSYGQRVRIVNISDGEGYAAAAALSYSKPEHALTRYDYRRFGKLRQREDRNALFRLGLYPRDITNLSYPDGMLDAVYTSSVPVNSPYTGLSRTPRSRPFTWESLKADIVDIMKRTAPLEIYVTDETDAAEDHQAVGRIVLDAARSLKVADTVRTYVIHEGSDNAELTDRQVLRVLLTKNETERKRRAISDYRTQTALDGSFLSSFARPDEYFYKPIVPTPTENR